MQYVKRYGQKTNVHKQEPKLNGWKDRARIPMIAVEGKDKNSKVCKSRARIPVLGRMRSKFQ